MKGRWSRALAWAGLTSYGDPALVSVPWKTAARAWVLIYLGSTFAMASIIIATDALMGEGISSAEALAPMFGAAMFIGMFGGGRRVTRSTPTTGRRRIRTETWAAIIAWVALFGMAMIADRFFHLHQAAGWARFGLSVGMATLACAVFVAVTHVPSHPARSD